MVCNLQYVKDVQQNDDRNGDTDKKQEKGTHETLAQRVKRDCYDFNNGLRRVLVPARF